MMKITDILSKESVIADLTVDSKKNLLEELADLASLDRTYITSVECGKRNISIVNIEKLAIALKVTLAEFFTF